MRTETEPMMREGATRLRVISWILDVALVALFVAIGRASHGEDQSAFTATLLPFLAAVLAGRAFASVSGGPIAVRWTGLIVWGTTVVLGLVLRVASGGGFQVSFGIVTTIVLAVFLLGWRLLARLVLRAGRSRRS